MMVVGQVVELKHCFNCYKIRKKKIILGVPFGRKLYHEDTRTRQPLHQTGRHHGGHIKDQQRVRTRHGAKVQSNHDIFQNGALHNRGNKEVRESVLQALRGHRPAGHAAVLGGVQREERLRQAEIRGIHRGHLRASPPAGLPATHQASSQSHSKWRCSRKQRTYDNHIF